MITRVWVDLTTHGGDISMLDGPHEWSYLLDRTGPSGAWRIDDQGMGVRPSARPDDHDPRRNDDHWRRRPHRLSVPTSFRPTDDECCQGRGVRADLGLHLGVRHEVVDPGRVVVCSCGRAGDEVGSPLAGIGQRGHPRRNALRADRVQEEQVAPLEGSADLAGVGAELIDDADVEVTRDGSSPGDRRVFRRRARAAQTAGPGPRPATAAMPRWRQDPWRSEQHWLRAAFASSRWSDE